MRRSWVPPGAHVNTGRLCSAGSGSHSRSPTSQLVCGPPTPLLSSASAPVVPRLRPTSPRALLLCPTRGRQRVRPRTCCTSERVHRISVAPVFFEEEQGPPRLLGRPLRACRGRRPRRVRRSPRPCRRVRCGLQAIQSLGHPGCHRFRGCMAHGPRPTRSRAYASTHPSPETLQGSLPVRAGSPLTGRVSHPLDDVRGFPELIASFIPPWPAGPGRN